jgi:shikimate dehydrogenase
MHEQEAKAQGLVLSYDLIDFARDGLEERDLPAKLDSLAAAGYAGVNVTYPYKQSVIPLLDCLSPGAARIGAVNTIRFEGGRRTGHNTDVTGFGESLRLDLPGVDLERVVQVGAGGAGLATAQALLDCAAREVLVHDVDPVRTRALVDRLQPQAGAGRLSATSDLRAAIATATGVVNATPVGMASSPGIPFPPEWLRPAQWVADVIYFPLETELLRSARALGCRTLDGSGMAIRQAAAAFQIFTGRTADVDRMRRSFAAFPEGALVSEAGS